MHGAGGTCKKSLPCSRQAIFSERGHHASWAMRSWHMNSSVTCAPVQVARCQHRLLSQAATG